MTSEHKTAQKVTRSELARLCAEGCGWKIYANPPYLPPNHRAWCIDHEGDVNDCDVLTTWSGAAILIERARESQIHAIKIYFDMGEYIFCYLQKGEPGKVINSKGHADNFPKALALAFASLCDPEHRGFELVEG
ncbi:MAG: hypothetical protein ACE5JO_09115 [Candidatus Binatia bacterium]